MLGMSGVVHSHLLQKGERVGGKMAWKKEEGSVSMHWGLSGRIQGTPGLCGEAGGHSESCNSGPKEGEK